MNPNPQPTSETSQFTRLTELIRQLYSIVDELERLFPGRSFTPDGHLVGSIGEAVAAYVYDLELFCSSKECHDATARDGRLVQVKLTGGSSRVGIRAEPAHLIVLQLSSRKEFIEVYNGPGTLPWQRAGKVQKNGQRSISLSRLRELHRQVPAASVLPQCRELKSLMDGKPNPLSMHRRNSDPKDSHA